MKPEEIKEFEYITAAFAFRDLQTFVTILLVLDANKKSVNDLEEYVLARREHDMRRQAVRTKKMLPCPKCSKVSVMKFPVNCTSCTQVGGDYKFQLSCQNPECDYDQLK
jgi:hypothetical protein